MLPATSAAGGEPEGIGRKTDIADGMSEAEGRPDVPEAWPELLLLAITGYTAVRRKAGSAVRKTPSETAESALVSCGSVDCGQFVLESVLFRTPRTPHVGRERAVHSPLQMLGRADNETASGIPDDNDYIGFRRYGDGCCLAQVA